LNENGKERVLDVLKESCTLLRRCDVYVIDVVDIGGIREMYVIRVGEGLSIGCCLQL